MIKCPSHHPIIMQWQSRADVIPDSSPLIGYLMSAIRLGDGVAMAAHQNHVPYVRSAIAFHCKLLSYLVTLTGSRLLTILSMSLQMLNWIKVSRFGLPRQNVNSMNLQKVKSRVCGMRNRTNLHQGHTPVISERLV